MLREEEESNQRKNPDYLSYSPIVYVCIHTNKLIVQDNCKICNMTLN